MAHIITIFARNLMARGVFWRGRFGVRFKLCWQHDSGASVDPPA